MTCRKRRDDVKTGVESLSRDQRGGDPLTARVASGIKVARVRSWLEQGTWEPVASMPREKPKWKPHEGPSTDAGHRGGLARSSVEVPVMGMERRGQIIQSCRGVNQAIGMNPTGRRGRRPGDKSRMSREAPVRFREGLGVKFPRATRLVICCRGTADDAMAVMQGMMSKLKLTVNETKTRLCRLPEESFDFLGYTIGRCHSLRTGEAYIGPRPSRKSIDRLCRSIGEMTERRWASRQVDYQVAEINRKLKGWAGYFRLGTVQRAYRLVDNHVRYRLRRWLKAKYKVRGPGKTRFPKGYLYEDLGLYSLQGWAGGSSSAKV
jgi:Group II intron, maturase-specific domain